MPLEYNDTHRNTNTEPWRDVPVLSPDRVMPEKLRFPEGQDLEDLNDYPGFKFYVEEVVAGRFAPDPRFPKTMEEFRDAIKDEVMESHEDLLRSVGSGQIVRDYEAAKVRRDNVQSQINRGVAGLNAALDRENEAMGVAAQEIFDQAAEIALKKGALDVVIPRDQLVEVNLDGYGDPMVKGRLERILEAVRDDADKVRRKPWTPARNLEEAHVYLSAIDDMANSGDPVVAAAADVIATLQAEATARVLGHYGKESLKSGEILDAVECQCFYCGVEGNNILVKDAKTGLVIGGAECVRDGGPNDKAVTPETVAQMVQAGTVTAAFGRNRLELIRASMGADVALRVAAFNNAIGKRDWQGVKEINIEIKALLHGGGGAEADLKQTLQAWEMVVAAIESGIGGEVTKNKAMDSYAEGLVSLLFESEKSKADYDREMGDLIQVLIKDSGLKDGVEKRELKKWAEAYRGVLVYVRAEVYFQKNAGLYGKLVKDASKYKLTEADMEWKAILDAGIPNDNLELLILEMKKGGATRYKEVEKGWEQMIMIGERVLGARLEAAEVSMKGGSFEDQKARADAEIDTLGRNSLEWKIAKDLYGGVEGNVYGTWNSDLAKAMMREWGLKESEAWLAIGLYVACDEPKYNSRNHQGQAVDPRSTAMVLRDALSISPWWFRAVGVDGEYIPELHNNPALMIGDMEYEDVVTRVNNGFPPRLWKPVGEEIDAAYEEQLSRGYARKVETRLERLEEVLRTNPGLEIFATALKELGAGINDFNDLMDLGGGKGKEEIDAIKSGGTGPLKKIKAEIQNRIEKGYLTIDEGLAALESAARVFLTRFSVFDTQGMEALGKDIRAANPEELWWMVAYAMADPQLEKDGIERSFFVLQDKEGEKKIDDDRTLSAEEKKQAKDRLNAEIRKRGEQLLERTGEYAQVLANAYMDTEKAKAAALANGMTEERMKRFLKEGLGSPFPRKQTPRHQLAVDMNTGVMGTGTVESVGNRLWQGAQSPSKRSSDWSDRQLKSLGRWVGKGVRKIFRA